MFNENCANLIVNGKQLTQRYNNTLVIDNVDIQIEAGCSVCLIGPDGVGKSTLLALIAGARKIHSGNLNVLYGDMQRASHRNIVCPKIAYMPQGLGKNLYPTLSVAENLHFFGRLFGLSKQERTARIYKLTYATGLDSFLDRPVQKLSGGMKQKLGLCCALIHDPQLLILDEPTTGVDPLARRQFWELIASIKAQNKQMSVIVATAYMDEASQFEQLIAMDDGKILATGSLQSILEKTNSQSLEQAFIALLPFDKRQGYQPVVMDPLVNRSTTVAIEALNLTKKFDDFIAVDNVSFKIAKGEIFGFLGSNGCGKSTTMKMLTGLLAITTGEAKLFNQAINAKDYASRHRVGYMSQAFSLYNEQTVLQNLYLHARLFHVSAAQIDIRVSQMLTEFSLGQVKHKLARDLPMGIKQRLSLAVALVHKPELLILDEPTSGVDPIARDDFWRKLIKLARVEQVTIFVATHFMNEAARCDRISFMHAGRVLVSASPDKILKLSKQSTLEDAFIYYLEQAGAGEKIGKTKEIKSKKLADKTKKHNKFSFRRMFSYTMRESLELKRDPLRALMASMGSLILLVVLGFGISFDVEDLTFAVLDYDQTNLSQSYSSNIAGSRYFNRQEPLTSYAKLDKRMQAGELGLALEIPPNFAKNVQRGNQVKIAAWIDGSNPQRAETIKGYVQGMHYHWLEMQALENFGYRLQAPINIENRFRYNPDVKSLVAMMPAVIPLMLLLFPAILTALSVVREKEMGSIMNLYVTPVTKAEFLIGKQLPYIVFGLINLLLMVIMVTMCFKVELTGSFTLLVLASIFFIIFATGLGLLASVFTNSQISAMFITLLGTILPAINYAGLLNPVSSLEGVGRIIGEIFPATYMLIISRGIFSKALGFPQLSFEFSMLVLLAPVALIFAIVLLKKQEQ